jgi:hypothetical protein
MTTFRANASLTKRSDSWRISSFDIAGALGFRTINSPICEGQCLTYFSAGPNCFLFIHSAGVEPGMPWLFSAEGEPPPRQRAADGVRVRCALLANVHASWSTINPERAVPLPAPSRRSASSIASVNVCGGPARGGKSVGGARRRTTAESHAFVSAVEIGSIQSLAE